MRRFAVLNAIIGGLSHPTLSKQQIFAQSALKQTKIAGGSAILFSRGKFHEMSKRTSADDLISYYTMNPCKSGSIAIAHQPSFAKSPQLLTAAHLSCDKDGETLIEGEYYTFTGNIAIPKSRNEGAGFGAAINLPFSIIRPVPVTRYKTNIEKDICLLSATDAKDDDIALDSMIFGTAIVPLLMAPSQIPKEINVSERERAEFKGYKTATSFLFDGYNPIQQDYSWYPEARLDEVARLNLTKPGDSGGLFAILRKGYGFILMGSLKQGPGEAMCDRLMTMVYDAFSTSSTLPEIQSLYGYEKSELTQIIAPEYIPPDDQTTNHNDIQNDEGYCFPEELCDSEYFKNHYTIVSHEEYTEALYDENLCIKPIRLSSSEMRRHLIYPVEDLSDYTPSEQEKAKFAVYNEMRMYRDWCEKEEELTENKICDDDTLEGIILSMFILQSEIAKGGNHEINAKKEFQKLKTNSFLKDIINKYQ